MQRFFCCCLNEVNYETVDENLINFENGHDFFPLILKYSNLFIQ